MRRVWVLGVLFIRFIRFRGFVYYRGIGEVRFRYFAVGRFGRGWGYLGCSFGYISIGLLSLVGCY